MQSIESCLTDAIEIVSGWDLPDAEFADAVNAQAKLMAGVPSDEPWRIDSEAPTH